MLAPEYSFWSNAVGQAAQVSPEHSPWQSNPDRQPPSVAQMEVTVIFPGVKDISELNSETQCQFYAVRDTAGEDCLHSHVKHDVGRWIFFLPHCQLLLQVSSGPRQSAAYHVTSLL